MNGPEPELAQAGHAELAEIAVQALHVPGAQGAGAGGVVVVPAQKVEGAVGELGEPVQAAGIDLARPREERDPDIAELAVGEARPEMAGRTVRLDEDFQAALGRRRIARRGLAVARQQRVAESVERRARTDQRRLERRQRLGRIDQKLLVVGCRACGRTRARSRRRAPCPRAAGRRRGRHRPPSRADRGSAGSTATTANRPRRPSRTSARSPRSTATACDGRARPAPSPWRARHPSRGPRRGRWRSSWRHRPRAAAR